MRGDGLVTFCFKFWYVNRVVTVILLGFEMRLPEHINTHYIPTKPDNINLPPNHSPHLFPSPPSLSPSLPNPNLPYQTPTPPTPINKPNQPNNPPPGQTPYPQEPHPLIPTLSHPSLQTSFSRIYPVNPVPFSRFSLSLPRQNTCISFHPSHPPPPPSTRDLFPNNSCSSFENPDSCS